MKKKKPNPVYTAGRQAGMDNATDIFHRFLTERMESLQSIKGIGEKTAQKVHEHFLKGLGKE